MSDEETDHIDQLLARLDTVRNLSMWLLGGAFSVGIWVASLEWRHRISDDHIEAVKAEILTERTRNETQETRLYNASERNAVIQNDITYIRQGIEELKSAIKAKP